MAAPTPLADQSAAGSERNVSSPLSRASHLFSHFSSSSFSSDFSVFDGVAVVALEDFSTPANVLEKILKAIALPVSSVSSIVLSSRGPFFSPQARLFFLSSRLEGAGGAGEERENLNKLCLTIRNSYKPIIAAISGPCLNGAFEVFLSCHCGFSLFSSSFGLVGLRWGLVEGASAIARVKNHKGARTTLVTKALENRTISASEALALGILTGLADDENSLLKKAIQHARASGPSNEISQPAVEAEDFLPSLRSSVLSRLPQFSVFLSCFSHGLSEGNFTKALEFEDFQQRQLLKNKEIQALIHVHAATEAAKRGVSSIASSPSLSSVGVVGCGTLGCGIALAFLMADYSVIVKEINEKALADGFQAIRQQYERLAKARALSVPFSKLAARLTGSLTLESFKGVSLVVESALEDLKAKQEIFADLERICPRDAILSTNTSSLSIEKIAALTSSLPRVVGLHFFVPAHLMPLLEVVHTKMTQPDVLTRCFAIGARIGKVPVLSGDCGGFIANRIYSQYGMAAALLVECGLEIPRIDSAIERFGIPLGPFRMADLSGIDIYERVFKILRAQLGDRGVSPSLGDLLVKQGRCGQKTGRGYYRYDKNTTTGQFCKEELEPFIQEARRAAGPLPDLSGFEDNDIVDFLFFPVVNEGRRILAQGIARSSVDIDLASLYGYSFPQVKGGVFFWAERTRGFDVVDRRLRAWQELFGEKQHKMKTFFQPAENQGKEKK